MFMRGRCCTVLKASAGGGTSNMHAHLNGQHQLEMQARLKEELQTDQQGVISLTQQRMVTTTAKRRKITLSSQKVGPYFDVVFGSLLASCLREVACLLQGFGEGTNQLVVPLRVVQKDANRIAVVDMICKDNRPAAMVDTRAFKGMVSELTDGAWEPPCKQVVKQVRDVCSLTH